LWDTAGQAEYDRLRPLAYPQTDCFILCFSVMSDVSYRNVDEKWALEIKHHSEKVPRLLVGTKIDMRTNSDEVAKLKVPPVTMDQGEALRKKIGARKYLECSALTQQGLAQVFEEAVRLGVNKDAPWKEDGKRRGGCIIL